MFRWPPRRPFGFALGSHTVCEWLTVWNTSHFLFFAIPGFSCFLLTFCITMGTRKAHVEVVTEPRGLASPAYTPGPTKHDLSRLFTTYLLHILHVKVYVHFGFMKHFVKVVEIVTYRVLVTKTIICFSLTPSCPSHFFDFSVFPNLCVCMCMRVKPFLTLVMADAGSWRELPHRPGGRVGMWRSREPQWDKKIYMAHSPHIGKDAQNVSTDVSLGADLSFRFNLQVFGFFLSCWSVWV